MRKGRKEAACRGGRAKWPGRRLRTNRRTASSRGGPIGIIVDAGPLYAYVDADDRHHHECLTILQEHPGPLIVPTLVITEVVSLLGTRIGPHAQVRFLGDLASGALTVERVQADDWLRIAQLVAMYQDLPLGTVDASVVTTAERLGVTTLATLDHRHFTVVRPAVDAAFELLP